jgi:hypothetical protein
LFSKTVRRVFNASILAAASRFACSSFSAFISMIGILLNYSFIAISNFAADTFFALHAFELRR